MNENSHGDKIWWMIGLVVIVSSVLLFFNLSRLGVWEPWEASEIILAHEYMTRGPAPEITTPTDTSWNWTVVTMDGEPVARPLLKTWLTGLSLGDVLTASEVDVGALERRARLPMSLLLLAVTLLGFFWIRRFFDTATAVFGCIAFVTMPGLYIGVHNVASEMVYVAMTTAALMAYIGMVFDERRRMLYGLGFGIAMMLAFLDQRLMGLYLPLGVIAFFALTERAQDWSQSEEETFWAGRKSLLTAACMLGAAGLLILWGYVSSTGYEEATFRPHILQWFGVFLPLALFGALLSLSWKSDAARVLASRGGLIAAALVLTTVAVVAYGYGAANPILLENGVVRGKAPVLTFLLENHLFEPSLATSHMTFDIWVRQIGFSTLPWTALLPLAIGYCLHRRDDEHDSKQAAIKRFFIVWALFSVILIAFGSMWNHYFYPAYFPLAAAVAVALNDREFFSWARTRPMLLYMSGFAAVAIIMMLGKDLERFPVRYVEVYLALQPDFEFPEGFDFGRPFKLLKYGWMAFLTAFFFGLASWTLLTLRRIRKWPAAFSSWRAHRKNKDSSEPTTSDTSETPSIADPMHARVAERAALLEEDKPLTRMIATVESPRFFAPAILTFFTISAVLMLYFFLPQMVHHLSQRGVFETYQSARLQDEALFRYNVPAGERSIYLESVEALSNQAEFLNRFSEEERIFAVIPRSRLPSVQYEVRNRFQRNLHVLDRRSSRLVLVSNQLRDGEEDHNHLADAIVEDLSEIQHQVVVDVEGEKKHPVFDGQLELIGYSFDREPDADGIVTYRPGETMELTYYFRVLRRVPGNQQMFVHIDQRGNRINGDHYPLDGDFPTNWWLPGDVVKDPHRLEIDSYTRQGVYRVNMGFFMGSRRMQVTPREAHDGQNRVFVTEVRIGPRLGIF